MLMITIHPKPKLADIVIPIHTLVILPASSCLSRKEEQWAGKRGKGS